MFDRCSGVFRLEYIMLLKFPIILSRNQFFYFYPIILKFIKFTHIHIIVIKNT